MSDEGRSQRPQTMGNVLGMLADAMRSQRQRGLPRLHPEQITRIENAVEALKSRPSSESMPDSVVEARRGDPAPGDVSSQHPAVSSEPGRISGPTPTPRAMAGAERLERPDPKILQQKVEALSASKRVDLPPPERTEQSAKPVDMAMPWMVDESNPEELQRAEEARKAVELARQSRTFTQPSSSATATSSRSATAPQPVPRPIDDGYESPSQAQRESVARYEDSESPAPMDALRPEARLLERAVAAASPSPEPKAPTTPLEVIQANIRSCTKCSLCNTRKNAVPGQGASRTRLMFVGEGPGVRDDEFGEPFRDESGDLLTRMIQAMGLRREHVYISNVIKCVTPKNRQPFPDELAACTGHLRAEIAEVKPEVIIALGKTATEWFLGQGVKLSSVRGRWHNLNGVGLMPTYHPTYLLHQTSAKAHVWADLQLVMKHLNLPPTR